ncbi:hypothetical protein ACFPOA_04540 [Lysobacter niabensis]|uniref:hypothetical protein n=1 Tax=Agrilutibacter niabensis TaxID=380628 RepID=UPI0036095C43
MDNTATAMTPPSPARRAPRSRAPAKVERPQPSRIAFLGSAQASNEAGETVFVRSLCWPTLPTAWIDLTQGLSALWAGRGNPSPYAPIVDKPPSWLKSCAPQLAAPFCGTAAAEESSIAALLARTPMQAAVAVFDARDARITNGAHQQGLNQCLSVYDQFLRMPMRVPCTLLVSRSPAVDQNCQGDLEHCRPLFPNAPWLSDLRLQFWTEAPEPLPLELAQIVAAATARHVLLEHTSDPVFEAVLTKLAHNPFQRGRPVVKRRRR